MTSFIWQVRVYYEDTDAGGVVYYANYLKFMERARTEWLRERGIEQDELATRAGLLFVVRSLTVEYIAPARFNDLLEVHSEVLQRRRVSLSFEQRIVHAAATDKVLCIGRVQVACIDAARFKPQAIPPLFEGDRQ